jgi:hypothetical protein
MTRMKPLAVVLVLLAGLGGAFADSGPFNMDERPSQPEAIDKPALSPPSIETNAASKTEPPAAVGDVSSGPVGPQAAERPILPGADLRLNGELDSRSWNIALTPSETDGPATLTIGYKSALVVAPETSRLRVFIDDHLVLESPISASESMGKLSSRLPPGLLRPGPNLIRVEVSQRHRTDCSVASTYELWTEIYGSDSALHFNSAPTFQRIKDLNAAGVDRRGVAHLRIFAPALGQNELTSSILRFAQGVALLSGEPNQTVSVVDRASAPGGQGVLNVVVGTDADLQTALQSPPTDAATRPIVAFVDDQTLGPSTLVISGPTTRAVSQALDSIASVTDDPLVDQRVSIATSRWFAPDAPIAQGGGRYTLTQLGVRTQEFTGRRFVTQFMIGLPPDFYASAYGQATLLLDAAYSGEVLPGSHLDVFVNDHISATAPITTSGGAILRHLPVRLLMTHFKPGPNLVRFEAHLNTSADEACQTVGEVNLPSRFALFDTSEFVMPDYARIARVPDLAALMGAGFPYSRSTSPVALIMTDFHGDTVSAAATLLARIALAGGRIVPFELVPAAAVGDRNAIFVATAAQTPSDVLAQLGIDQDLRTAWKAPEIPEGDAKHDSGERKSQPTASDPKSPDELNTEATFNRWRIALADGGGWRGNVSVLQDWFQRTFQFSAGSLRFLPVADVAFEAPAGSTVVLAEGKSPGGAGAWLLLTAPTSKLLRQGADALTAQEQWSQIAGRIAIYNSETGKLSTQPVTTFAFLVTQPLTPGNLRLILANWLSDNILAYSVLLVSACVLLGLATSRFLARIGRGSA